ncbi:FliM/FliN family flagellar motor switch protein [Aquabacterium sp. A7-Y]|uniref:FliM/FliN family flagellar motor switch protein n=1 Tax=Aquabacterium sp. A7-Y TaxID=1349605 RepID=UPI00223DA62B|nr:FliM/FliN family flagellar motor switch protein [Aquabacterium sp. A7-Y]MCW7536983.1 FliM/FliN family flagellar motor switch protein [Aquabacterium sp. A7-Y]
MCRKAMPAIELGDSAPAARPWRPPTLPAWRRVFDRVLGDGLSARLTEIDPDAVLQLRRPVTGAAAADAGCDLALQGPAGVLWLHQGVRLLRALSGVDLGAASDESVQLWLQASALARLPEALRQAFDRIARPAAGEAPLRELPRIDISLRTFDHVIATHGWADTATLERLARGGFEPVPAAPPPRWTGALVLRAAVLVARHRLSAAALGALKPGDLILPGLPLFTPAGRGSVCIGGRRVILYFREDKVFEVESVELEQQQDKAGAPDDALPGGETAQDTSAWGDVAVELVFQLGSVSTAVADLARLGPGELLPLESAATGPNVEVLCHGRRLGRGELVDVDGRLAIRLTSWGRG